MHSMPKIHFLSADAGCAL